MRKRLFVIPILAIILVACGVLASNNNSLETIWRAQGEEAILGVELLNQDMEPTIMFDFGTIREGQSKTWYGYVRSASNIRTRIWWNGSVSEGWSLLVRLEGSQWYPLWEVTFEVGGCKPVSITLTNEKAGSNPIELRIVWYVARGE